MYQRIRENASCPDSMHTSNLTGDITSGVSNAFGSWFELCASAPHTMAGFTLLIGNDWDNLANQYEIDIGFGSIGNEIAITGVSGRMRSGFDPQYHSMYVPMMIPKGTRVSARARVSGVSAEQLFIEIGGVPYSSGSTAHGIYQTDVTLSDFLAGTPNAGFFQIDPGGTVNTKGAWTEFIASTSRDVKYMTLTFSDKDDTTTNSTNWFLDVGVGSAGNEVAIIQNAAIRTNSSSLTATFHGALQLPVRIPAGSRISVRAQCNNTDATDRLVCAFINLYG